MTGRAFLTIARETVRGPTEAHWRTATGRAYYALMLELRDAFARWGLSLPSRSFVHTTTLRQTFATSDRDVKQIGCWLEQLRDNRNLADYDLAILSEFASDAEAQRSIRRATDALSLFDALDADAPRRTTIFAEIQKVLP